MHAFLEIKILLDINVCNSNSYDLKNSIKVKKQRQERAVLGIFFTFDLDTSALNCALWQSNEYKVIPLLR